MSQAEIVWYSDFDGVYNLPKSVPDTSQAVVKTDSIFLQKKNLICWKPEIVSLFRELLETGHYDFFWHTTWNDNGSIQEAARLIGLEGFEKYTESNLHIGAQNRRAWTKWKAETIVSRQAVDDRPFIWIDDDAPNFWEDYVKGHTRAPSLILTPNKREGLSREHLIKVIDWTMKQRITK